MASNITISKSGQTSVTLFTTRLVENWGNAIEQYNRLRTASSYNKGNEKFLLDFLNIQRNFEVTGFIAKEQNGTTEATTLRTRLISLFTSGGNISISYLGETVSGAMTGLEFREVPSDSVAATPKFFMVTFSLLEGTQRSKS